MTQEESKQKLWAAGSIDTISKVECDNILNEVYDDLENRTCDNCAYRGDTEAECTLLIYILETSLFDTSSTFACNKWLQK